MERFILLPFSVGCISESSIPIGVQHAKRSKPDTHSTPSLSSRKSLKHGGGTDEGVKEEDDDTYLDNEESLTGENLKTILPRFQKLFQSLSHLFVNKDELEPEMGMEIGLPTDVKHVTHIGLDDCASSIFSKDWNNVAETELINLHSFHQTALELAMATQDEIPGLTSLLETKCKNYHDNPITSKLNAIKGGYLQISSAFRGRYGARLVRSEYMRCELIAPISSFLYQVFDQRRKTGIWLHQEKIS